MTYICVMKKHSHSNGANLLYTIIRTPSLVNLLPLSIMAALHDPISSFCSFALRLLTVWRTTPQKVLVWSLGLCSVVGILCHGEAADLGQVAQDVADQRLHVQDTACHYTPGTENVTHKTDLKRARRQRVPILLSVMLGTHTCSIWQYTNDSCRWVMLRKSNHNNIRLLQESKASHNIVPG